MNYEECVAYILDLPRFTTKNKMSHTNELMERLSNPEESFQVIHVAGSNGKGSVCAYINSVLTEASISTGLFTSPHLVDMRERFLINGRQCTKDQFVDAERKVHKVVEDMQEVGKMHPTFFEYIFAIGMILFQNAGVSCVILETGMGGRLDATNTIKHPLLTVITSISLEHTEILGDTIEKIAYEKAGIIKAGVPVICDGSERAAVKVIEEEAKKMNSPVTCIFPDNIKILLNTGKMIDFSLNTGYDVTNGIRIPYGATYQVRNAAVALAAVKCIQKELVIQKSAIDKGFLKVKWEGRMEEILPDIYLDGAHNPAGIQALLEAVDTMEATKSILLFAMTREKEVENVVKQICGFSGFKKIILTTIPNHQRMLGIKEMKKWFLKYRKPDVEIICMDTPQEAFCFGKQEQKEGQKIFCAGSLYFLGELKKLIAKE